MEEMLLVDATYPNRLWLSQPTMGAPNDWVLPSKACAPPCGAEGAMGAHHGVASATARRECVFENFNHPIARLLRPRTGNHRMQLHCMQALLLFKVAKAAGVIQVAAT